MARYKQGINGPFSGKVGTVVGASWLGIDYIRSVEKTVNKSASPAQLNQRIRFTLVMSWLKPVIPLINIGHQWQKKAKTALNAAISYHMNAAIIGTGPDCQIDFPNAVFSRGDLLPSFVRTVRALPGALLHISWENFPLSNFSRDTDKATFILYNPDKAEFVTFQDAAERADQETDLSLPPDFAGDPLHCWMNYLSADEASISTSIYLGQVYLV